MGAAGSNEKKKHDSNDSSTRQWKTDGKKIRNDGKRSIKNTMWALTTSLVWQRKHRCACEHETSCTWCTTAGNEHRQWWIKWDRLDFVLVYIYLIYMNVFSIHLYMMNDERQRVIYSFFEQFITYVSQNGLTHENIYL